MRIAVVAAGTRGDVEPHLALALALAERGHQVTVCAPIDFHQQARDLGVAFRPIRVSFRELYGTSDGGALLATDNNPLQFARVLRKIIVPVADQAMHDVGEACAGAELVLYSVLAVPAYYFARDAGVPAIATCLQPLGRTHAHPSPLYPFAHRLPGPLNHLTHVLAEQMLWQLYRPFLKRRWKTGLPLVSHFADVYRSRNPMLFAYSTSLIPRPAEYRPFMHVTGFWPLTSQARAWTPPADLTDFLRRGPAPVCVGFGSMNTRTVGAIMPKVLDALAARGKRAIVLTGWWDGGQAGLDALRERDDVYVTDSLPHSWLFQRVSSVIHHGGAGTTTAALRAGVPAVVVPFFFDQRFWGTTLQRRELGPEPIPARRFSASALNQALDQIDASRQFRRRLSDLSRRLLDEDGAASAADTIEEAMESAAMRVSEPIS